MIITQTRYGVGRHINHVPDEDKTIAVEFNFISQLFYVFAITCAKFSIGLFLLRILVSRFIRWTIIGVIGMLLSLFERAAAGKHEERGFARIEQRGRLKTFFIFCHRLLGLISISIYSAIVHGLFLHGHLSVV